MKKQWYYQSVIIGLAISFLCAANISEAQGRRGKGLWISGPQRTNQGAFQNKGIQGQGLGQGYFFIDLDGDGICDNTNGQAALDPLSDAEAATLTFMREEEKLARDVYLALYDLWSNPVFSMIASSEQKHMDAIKRQLDAYGLT